MKKTVTAISMVAIMACNGMKRQDGGTSPEAAYIGQPDVKTENGQMTPEVLWAFGRVGSVCVAPDGRRVACTVTYYSIPENRSNSDIYVMDTDGRNGKQLMKTATRESSLAWLPSGRAIAFLRDGKLWNIDPDTGKETQVSELGEPVEGFVYAPAEDRILLVISTKLERYTGAEIYGDLDRANAYIYDDLMYRHWDSWKDGRYSHLYVGDIRSGRVTDVEDIMPDEPCDSPTKPFGGTEEIAWSPDGKTIVYTCKKLTGKAYAFQTNSDLYAYDVATKRTQLLTPGMPGYDRSPQFSPDGTKLLWLSMRRAGFEADRERIMLMDWPAAPASAGSATASAAAPASTGSASASAAAPASTGSASAPTATAPASATSAAEPVEATAPMRDISEALDASPGSIRWTADSKALYLTAPHREAHQIYRLDPANGDLRQITDGNHDYQDVQIAGDMLIASRTTFVNPAEIYRVNPADGTGEQISFVNRELLNRINAPTFEKRFVTTTDNRQMVTWIFYPPSFDKSRKYPVLLVCTGGPQGVLGPSFSYRWNYMLMASQGYVVVLPARRGTSGSGQEWCDAISKNHGFQDEQDLLSAIDAVAKEPWADETRMGAAGASYGGYSIYHLAGTHRGRFKAFLAHCGIFNMEFMYTTTEEMFFENWETGGAPWDRENEVAQRSFAQSPHLLVKNWDTPIMVVHGERDFRVPYSQGMAAYNTAQMLGIESRLLIFPTETHWVLSPQNAIVWQREFFAWFNKHLIN